MGQSYRFGPFTIDPGKRALTRDGTSIPLTPKAFDLLLYLVQNPNQVVTKEELLQNVWSGAIVEEGNLTQNVFLLRKALAGTSDDTGMIVTVPRKGYQFAAEVTVDSGAAIQARGVAGYILEGEESTTRIVVEEEVEDAEVLDPPPIRALPSPPSSALWKWVLGWIALGALVGGLAVWLVFRPSPMPKVLRTLQITRFGGVEPFSRALSDGSRVFLAERVGGTWDAAEVPESSGDPTRIATSVPNIELLDIDRRQSRLLAVSQGPNGEPDSLWSISTAGGSGRRIGDVFADDATWSPDSQRIAYSRGTDLFVVGDDGSSPQKLFSARGVVEFLRWSPDGTTLSITVRDTYGYRSLWEIAADGRDAHPLAIGPREPVVSWGDGECCGDWSPDGNYFVYHSSRVGGTETLWLMRAKKRWPHDANDGPVRLYTSPDRLNQPRFTADGKKILFVNSQERRELVRYDAAKRLFVPYLGGIPARHLSFSRDGQWVAYKDQRDNSLWRSRLDGSDALQLTFPPLDAYHSTWSPDGKTIILEGSGKLYAVPFRGGKMELLLSGDGWGGQPSLSPDGKSLLFSRGAPGIPENIAMLDLGTQHVAAIPGSHEFECPQWSPDGKFAVASDKQDRKLVLFDFSTQRWIELADGLPYGWGLRWSSDSKYVYYQHAYGMEEQPIFRVRVSDHKVEQITSSRQILRADVLSYSMTGLTPDNSPLASLVHRNSDVFALELELP
jgi:DNA-binding winged helix-turn-helix (wHTH) protein/Tol biopolymer transport system component